MKCLSGLFWFCLLISGFAFAQTTGQITGTVHDPSGANVFNAKVTVSSPERGITRETATNTSGEYLVSGLPAGTYDLAVSAPGFKTYQAKGIVLRVAQKTRADAALQVGGTSSEVTVEGEGIGQVETQSSELSGVITGKEISQLQLNGRNFTQLATLVPGVNNQSGQDEGTVGISGNVAFSFNGGRTEYNNWELDGGDNMDNGSNSSLNVYPSIDAIAEVKVLTSNYGAQYGRSGSGTVEVETKSGTSSFHGDMYEFVRNTDFNARNYFQSYVPQYNKNDFGYTIGGPIFIPGHYNTDKQKSFFFWSQEWRIERTPAQTFNTPVPSNAERQGNFSDLCPNATNGSFADCPVNPATGQYFPNNQVPIDPAGAALLPLIPVANAGVPGAALYNASPVEPTNWREELLRLDQNLGQKWHLMFRYTHDTWNTVTPTSVYTGSYFPTVQTNYSGPAVSIVARATTNFTPTLLNEFLFSYTTDHISFTSTGTPNPNAWQRPPNLPMGAIFYNGFGGKLPAITLSGNAAYGGTFYEDPNGEWPEGPYNSNPTYTYRDNVSKSVGRHNMQFGGYFVAAQKNELSSQLVNGSLGFDTSATSVTTGNSFADLLLGQIGSFQQASTNIKFYNRYKIFEPYFQDDWRVTSRLTLNLGLRISMFGTYYEKYNHAYNWTPSAYSAATAPQIDDSNGSATGFPGALIPGTGNPFDGLVHCGTNGVPRGCMSGHLWNPAPRVGFAYDVFGDGTTAIRGGYGIFYEHTNGNEANTESLEGQSSPLIQTVTQYNISGYANIGGGTTGSTPIFPLQFISIPTKATWPYVQQWHLDIQRQLSKNTVLVLGYVGSKGTHLNRQDDLNQIYPVPASQNPYLPGEPIGGINNTSGDCS
ncbi:MAG TPA: TonB-dependent receptor, partial [Candidatus Angelobacter sp.]|nr:TonB-dependent receptor [Candidatus Angelobacter sp.]